MNENRFFGVELEAHPVLPSSLITDVIRKNSRRRVYFSGWKQTHSNSYWHLKTDSTCGGGVSRNGWEIASYKASGSSDLEDISNVADALSSAGLACGEDCGLHVHVDISDFDPRRAGILLARWAKIESVMMQSVPPRRSLCPHCRPIASKIKSKSSSCKPEAFWEMLRPTSFSAHRNPQKKVTLNMVNYATCLYYESNESRKYSWCDASRKTAEFRFPEGTLSGDDVRNWVRFFVSFVDSAVTMPENLKSVLSMDEFLSEIEVFCSEFPDSRIWLLERIALNSTLKKWRKASEKKLGSYK